MENHLGRVPQKDYGRTPSKEEIAEITARTSADATGDSTPDTLDTQDHTPEAAAKRARDWSEGRAQYPQSGRVSSKTPVLDSLVEQVRDTGKSNAFYEQCADRPELLVATEADFARDRFLVGAINNMLDAWNLQIDLNTDRGRPDVALEVKNPDSDNEFRTGTSHNPVVRKAMKLREEHIMNALQDNLAMFGLELAYNDEHRTVYVRPKNGVANSPIDAVSDPLDLRGRGRRLGELLAEKNHAYGSSFAKAADYLKLLYPDGVPVDKYPDMLMLVRDFDKSMRIATAKDALGESPWQDKAGYAILATTLTDKT